MKFKNDVEIQNSDLIVGTDIYTIGDTLKIQAGGTSGTYIEIDDTSGEVVVGADIFANNLSGTNTGDQNLSGYVTTSTTQTISGAKTFTSPTTINGGVGVNTSGGTLIVRQKGNSANDGIAITSAAATSHRIWKASDGKFHFGSSSQTTAFTQLLDGSVGIGTDSPTAKLQVYDDRDVTGNPTDKGIRLQESTGDWLLSLGISSVTNTGFAIRDNVTSTYPFVIRETTGNVGINESNPSARLEVDGSINFNSGGDRGFLLNPGAGTFSLGDKDEVGGGSFIESDSSNIDIYNNLALTLRADSNNRVGIGTDSPQVKLQVTNNIDNANVAMFKGKSTNTTNSTTISISNGFSTEYTKEVKIGAVAESASSNTTGMALYTSPNSSGGVERVRIDSTGNVGIGTTSPLEKLEVQGSIYATPIIYSSSQDAYALRMGANNNTAFDMGIKIKSTSAGTPYMSLRSHNTEDLLVLKSGNVGIGTDSPSEKLQVVGGTLLNGVKFNTGYGQQFISTGTGTTINFGQPTSYVQNVYVQGKIQANSSIRVGDNTATPSSSDAGAIRYRVSGNNSYVDVCMRTGNTTYAWVNIVQNQW